MVNCRASISPCLIPRASTTPHPPEPVPLLISQSQYHSSSPRASTTPHPPEPVPLLISQSQYHSSSPRASTTPHPLEPVPLLIPQSQYHSSSPRASTTPHPPEPVITVHTLAEGKVKLFTICVNNLIRSLMCEGVPHIRW